MKKSERILRKNSIPEGVPSLEREVIKNTTLLRHIIDNSLNHIWWWIRIIVLMILGLYAKLFVGGG